MDADQEFELHKLELQQNFEAKKTIDQINLEKEKLDRSQAFEARKEYARQTHDYSLQYEKHLKEYGQLTLRTIFLLNGGAILALLTFIGGTIGKSTGTTTLAPALFVAPFGKYVAGLVCTVISMLLAYVNYSFHHERTAQPGDLANNMLRPQESWPGNHSKGNSYGTNASWIFALIFGAGAVAFFAWGCWQVASVFGGLK